MSRSRPRPLVAGVAVEMLDEIAEMELRFGAAKALRCRKRYAGTIRGQPYEVCVPRGIMQMGPLQAWRVWPGMQPQLKVARLPVGMVTPESQLRTGSKTECECLFGGRIPWRNQSTKGA